MNLSEENPQLPDGMPPAPFPVQALLPLPPPPPLPFGFTPLPASVTPFYAAPIAFPPFPPAYPIPSSFNTPSSAPIGVIPHSLSSSQAGGLLKRPRSPAQDVSEVTVAAATVSAAPELRDFKKEATTFVPHSLKRRKAAASSSSSRVNAAPVLDGSGEVTSARPDLVNILKGQFPSPAENVVSNPAPPPAIPKKKDEYQAFVEGLSDIL